MAKKRTKAQRSAAAKASWQLRKLKSAKTPTPVAVSPTGWNANTPVLDAPGYEVLARELTDAFVQSSEGKGKERHANDRPFDRQPILELGRLYGPGFAAGQAAKKVQEALSMQAKGKFTKEQALAEVHGGIVYLAALASLIREG